MTEYVLVALSFLMTPDGYQPVSAVAQTFPSQAVCEAKANTIRNLVSKSVRHGRFYAYCVPANQYTHKDIRP